MSDDRSSGLPRLHLPDDDERGAAETRLLAPGEMLSGGKKRIPWFIGVQGTRSTGRLFPIRSGMTVGRAIGSDILLDEEGVSRRHAKLKVLSTGQVLIEDLASSNGIFYGEQRVERRILSDGERIRIGDVVLMLALLEPPDQGTEVALEAVDPETRLPNRAYIIQNLADTLHYAGRYEAPVALCLFLVDQLQHIHDTQGAAVASNIIVQLATSARNLLQDSEAVIGRFAEDEIAIVLPDANLEHGSRCAEWIRRAVEAAPVRVGSELVRITITGGVAANEVGQSNHAARLVEQARRNLCRALVAGRNTIEPRLEVSSQPVARGNR
jgi:diguanylate cyclase (GGDEF)-like protein